MRLVIVDRDGVINEDSADYIRSVDEMRFIDGSLEGLGLLTQAGFSVAVATNQSGIARGYFDVDTLNRMHGALCTRAAAVGARIDAVAFCPHGPADRCACRKPSPGLLITLARRFSVGIETHPSLGIHCAISKPAEPQAPSRFSYGLETGLRLQTRCQPR